MSGTGKTVNVLRRSPVQQNGTSAPRGKVSKTPQGRGSKSSVIVLAPMNGELARQEEAKSLGTRGRSSSFGKEEMNLMAARKVDPSVTNILSTVSQVKLYLYDPASGEWVCPCSLFILINYHVCIVCKLALYNRISVHDCLSIHT